MAGLAIGAIALAAASVLVLVWAAVSHLRFAAAERRRRLLEMRLRPAALALIDEDEQPVFTSRAEAEVFADLLGRYSRQLQGDARARIAGFFERSGAVGLVVAALRDRRPWTRAEAAFSLGDMGSPAAVEPLLDAL
ncbi:MAG TPA: HEAT repeat domain-containing protein, partial [Gaiellaceae bacterium]